MSRSSIHIANIDKTLKNIKSNIMADFIHINHYRLIIITNKVVSLSDFNIIKKYIKNVDNIKLEDIIFLYLPQLNSI